MGCWCRERKSNAMKTAIDRILAAEEDAKRRVADAQQQAHALLKKTEAQGEELRSAARARTQAESRLFLQKTSADAESAGLRDVDAAKAKADQILLRAEHLDLAFLAHDIDGIAGIE